MYPAQDTYPAARSGYDLCTDINHPFPLVERIHSMKVQEQAAC